jgi:hypothetical protein
MESILNWAKQLQAIAQAGKTFSKDKFDLERFDQIARHFSPDVLPLSDSPIENIQQLFLYLKLGILLRKLVCVLALLKRGKSF